MDSQSRENVPAVPDPLPEEPPVIQIDSDDDLAELPDDDLAELPSASSSNEQEVGMQSAENAEANINPLASQSSYMSSFALSSGPDDFDHNSDDFNDGLSNDTSEGDLRITIALRNIEDAIYSSSSSSSDDSSDLGGNDAMEEDDDPVTSIIIEQQHEFPTEETYTFYDLVHDEAIVAAAAVMGSGDNSYFDLTQSSSDNNSEMDNQNNVQEISSDGDQPQSEKDPVEDSAEGSN